MAFPVYYILSRIFHCVLLAIIDMIKKYLIQNELFLFKQSHCQQIVINYKRIDLLEKKQSLPKEEYKQCKQRIYGPYLVLKHNNILESFLRGSGGDKGNDETRLELLKFLEESVLALLA